MSVLDRSALEASPLADLHAIASELSLDGYRRLRKADLINAIIARQSGDADADTEDSAADDTAVEAPAAEDSGTDAEGSEESGAAGRRRRGRRGGRGRTATKETASESEDSEPAEAPAAKAGADAARVAETVEGVVELLANGSGFVRVNGSEPSDDDVYISAAQVKRCELVSGDTVSGPRRAPQRSERFASLVRVDTINGKPASEVSDGSRYDDLPATFPTERFKFGTGDPTLQAIEFLTPLGRGSRVAIVGGAWSGKSHTLKALAAALAADTELTTLVALAGVRPEELTDWDGAEGVPAPATSLSFAASTDALDHAVELVVDQARRVATRGGNAVVLVDTIDALHPHTARKVLASARNLKQGGSVTVIATAAKPLGGETTIISLDATLVATGRFPALDLVSSGTLAADLLVGEAGARAIAEARAEAQAIA